MDLGLEEGLGVGSGWPTDSGEGSGWSGTLCGSSGILHYGIDTDSGAGSEALAGIAESPLETARGTEMDSEEDSGIASKDGVATVTEVWGGGGGG